MSTAIMVENTLNPESRKAQKVSKKGKGGFNKRTPVSWLVVAFMLASALAWISPLYLAFVNSVKTPEEYTTTGPLTLPSEISFEGIIHFWEKAD
ncbi:MAG: carbohydrate ABC transporter permease, partial [Aurantimicrobium sp.]